jgi:hypothetical protein
MNQSIKRLRGAFIFDENHYSFDDWTIFEAH